MRLLLLGLVALTASATVSAQVYVRGYTTKNGTYVAPHYRSSPDGNPFNNYSTRGNVNPYTRQVGTKDPYGSYGSQSYGSYGNYSNPYSSGSYGNYSNPYSSGSYGNYSNPYSNQSDTSDSQTCLYYSPC